MLNSKQLETLQYISEFKQEFLDSPSLQEMSLKFSISPAGVSLRIKRLEENGYVERLGNRAIRITTKGYEALANRRREAQRII